jgi:MFS family permease
MYNKRAWAIWCVATLFVAFQLFIGILFGISIKEMATAFSISTTDVSNIVALYFFSYAVMQIPAGFIIDRLSIKYTLFVVALIIVAGLFILAMAHSVILAYIAAAFMGIASSFNFVSAVILIGRWFSPKMFSVAVGLTSGCNGLILDYQVF